MGESEFIEGNDETVTGSDLGHSDFGMGDCTCEEEKEEEEKESESSHCCCDLKRELRIGV